MVVFGTDAHKRSHTSMVAELGRREVVRIRKLTREANQLECDIARRVTQQVPRLLEIPGCGTLTAVKLVGEAAAITRFKSRDAYAIWAGTAPIPVWSANNQRFRLNRGANRQTNAAIHRIAITQLRILPTLKRSSPAV
jgi:transposase